MPYDATLCSFEFFALAYEPQITQIVKPGPTLYLNYMDSTVLARSGTPAVLAS